MGVKQAFRFHFTKKQFFKNENLTPFKRVFTGTVALSHVVVKRKTVTDKTLPINSLSASPCIPLAKAPQEGLTLSANYIMLIGLLL